MGGKSVWNCTTSPGSSNGAWQSGHSAQGTSTMRSTWSGVGVGRTSAAWPFLRPGFLRRFFSLRRRKRAAWRLLSRRRSSISWRRRSTSLSKSVMRALRRTISWSRSTQPGQRGGELPIRKPVGMGVGCLLRGGHPRCNPILTGPARLQREKQWTQVKVAVNRYAQIQPPTPPPTHRQSVETRTVPVQEQSIQTPTAPQTSPAPPSSSNPTRRTQNKSNELEALIRKLASRTTTERLDAVQRLGAMGEDAIDASRALCQALLDRSHKVQLAAAEAIERVNPIIHKLVITIVVDQNPANRLKAVIELGRLKEQGSPGVPIVLYFKEAFGGTTVMHGNTIHQQSGGTRQRTRHFDRRNRAYGKSGDLVAAEVLDSI